MVHKIGKVKDLTFGQVGYDRPLFIDENHFIPDEEIRGWYKMDSKVKNFVKGLGTDAVFFMALHDGEIKHFHGWLNKDGELTQIG